MGVAVDTRPAVARDRQQAPRNETAAERAEIEVATEISEAGDRSPDLALILRAKQCAQVAIRTDIAWWKHVEPAAATQQYEPGRPGAHALERREACDCISGRERLELLFVQLATRNHRRHRLQRACLLCGEPAGTQRCRPRSGDRHGSWKGPMAFAAVLHPRTELLDHASNHSHASVEAHLLERNDTRKRLEEARETRGSQAAQRVRCGPDRRLACRPRVQRRGIDVESQQTPQRARDFTAHRGVPPGVTHEQAQVWRVGAAAIDDLGQRKAAGCFEHPSIATIRPHIDPVRRPALQHPNGRLEIKRPASRELHRCDRLILAVRKSPSTFALLCSTSCAL